jgi:hypothetical protein
MRMLHVAAGANASCRWIAAPCIRRQYLGGTQRVSARVFEGTVGRRAR